MNLIRRWRANSAAKAYARKLRPWLQRQFGASEFYTPAQIDRAVQALKLDGRYVAFGYALFLPAAAFQELQAEMPVRISYQQARATLERWHPSIWASANANPEDSGYATVQLPD